jgi:ketosteroid isomerase-like protein
MSKNSELVRKGYAAWSHDDRDAWLETLHPDVEIRTSGIWPDFDPIYHGHEGLAEFWRRMYEAWEEFRIDIERLDEECDCFVLALRFRGTGAGSGVEVDLKFANAIRMHEGLQAEIISLGARSKKLARRFNRGSRLTRNERLPADQGP